MSDRQDKLDQVVREQFDERYLDTVPGRVQAPEVGFCRLCGQEMLRTEDDCWHPYTVAKACPPEVDHGGFQYAQWGSTGRPGREHFVEANGEC